MKSENATSDRSICTCAKRTNPNRGRKILLKAPRTLTRSVSEGFRHPWTLTSHPSLTLRVSTYFPSRAQPLVRPTAAGRGVFGNDRRIAGGSQQNFVRLPFFDLHERRAAVGGADAELPGSLGVVGDGPKVIPNSPLEVAHLSAPRVRSRRRADFVQRVAVVRLLAAAKDSLEEQ